MTRRILIFSVALLLVAISSADFPSWKHPDGLEQHIWRVPVDIAKLNDNGGGGTCAACTIGVFLIQQYSSLHQLDIDTFISEQFCEFFTESKANETCKSMQKRVGPNLIAALAETADPDDVCNKVGLCTDSTCDLVKNETNFEYSMSQNWAQYVSHKDDYPTDVNGPIQWLKDLINRVFDQHLPLTDIDGDKFSGSVDQLRGAHWRGKDCDDLDGNIYPGRKVDPYDLPAADYNCNGIKGTNPDTKKAYEEELCADSGPVGVAVFGDSVGAHFEIPPQWLNASEWAPHVFDGIIGKALDEMDVPYKSAFTGYADSTDKAPVDSFYKRMVERNHCNHRDFQNLGVNGAASDNFDNVKAFARDQQKDNPVIIGLELVGNDVCNGHPNFTHMTTPDKFYAGVVKILRFIDSVVPAGSHVMMLGLADGRILYETLHDRIHPTGVPYPDLYDYLNCLELSPCWGWMNDDEAVRNKTYDVAVSLNAQYPKIMANEKFDNFDMLYYEFPIKDIMDKWVAAGHDAADLIEPVDGFHPSQQANALFAEWIWNHLEQDKPEWLGSVNSNNDKIKQLFGDQGGY